MNEQLFFWDGDEIIGISNAIMEQAQKDLKENNGDEDMIKDLIEQLEPLDYEIVKCWYHPMGAWVVNVLEAKK